MAEGLKLIGKRFREKREEMNLSLKEIEGATSIRMMYLQAIEDGNIDHFLSAAYTIGFIKQYAGFLGFDLDSLLKQHPDALRVAVEKQEFAYGIGTLEARGSPPASIRWMPNLLWGSATLLLVICGYFFGKAMGLF